MLSLPQSSRSSLAKILTVLFVLSIAAFMMVPSYLNQQWPWQRVPDLQNVSALKAVQKDGLTLPGWQTVDQETVEIGGHQWSLQKIAPTGEPATTENTLFLLLRPQIWHRDWPQVDWMDINGTYQWTADSLQTLNFSAATATDHSATIQARFLRGWSQNRTYAIVQWYSWATGGHSAPSRWFLADQWSQLRDRRHTAWVAVSLLMPMQPLGDITSLRPQATTLSQQIQTTLMADVF